MISNVTQLSINNDAERLREEIRSVAGSASCHVIEAPLDTDQATYPTVALDVDELLSFVAAVRPPILYVFATELDVEAEVVAAAEELGVERGDRAFAQITRASRCLSAYQGQPARTSVEVVTGGVLHLAYAAAPWIMEFESEMEAMSARISEESAMTLQNAKKTASRRIRALAERLLSDPVFNIGRSSFAKRRFLAGEIFPDEDEMTLDAVTEAAENMRWLATARG